MQEDASWFCCLLYFFSKWKTIAVLYVINLRSWEKQAWKKEEEEKIQAWTGFEPMTSAILAQRSNQLSYQANWKLVTCEFVIYPWME